MRVIHAIPKGSPSIVKHSASIEIHDKMIGALIIRKKLQIPELQITSPRECCNDHVSFLLFNRSQFTIYLDNAKAVFLR